MTNKISFAGEWKTLSIRIPQEMHEDLKSICGEETPQTFTKKLIAHWLKKFYPDRYSEVVWDCDIDEYKK